MKLVERDVGGRGGAKAYRLTRLGQEKLTYLLPVWEQAQVQVRGILGDRIWNNMPEALQELSKL
ncbi:hypothetical protein [Flexibacterium corallicola]|uniref:hypothetical protein n=1 Tax=Flexibacterium corallicola TaxID=3037259 RepID=UPI00286EE5C2|nr:hypothetical protein [Pseudovibrio sp. M1P-2-3]